jgi:hypothetical protein
MGMCFIGLNEARLFNGRWAAKVVFLHGYPAAAIADIFHLRQFTLAHMFGLNVGCAAEAALLGISAGVAQVTGRLGHGTAVFTGIGHGLAPLQSSKGRLDWG